MTYGILCRYTLTIALFPVAVYVLHRTSILPGLSPFGVCVDFITMCLFVSVIVPPSTFILERLPPSLSMISSNSDLGWYKRKK